MGSDGIWSILTNEEVATLAILGTAKEIAKRVLAGIFAKPEEPFDNISMIVIKTKKPGARIPAGEMKPFSQNNSGSEGPSIKNIFQIIFGRLGSLRHLCHG